MTKYVAMVALVLATILASACSGDSPTAPTSPSPAELTAKFSAYTGNGLRLVVTDVTVYNDADPVASRSWNFGDGSPAQQGGKETPHVYSSEGNFTVSLTVKTASGQSATASAAVSVKMLEKVIMTFYGTSPAPLPAVVGPQGKCSATTTVAGMFRPNFVVSPGGTLLKAYMVKYSDLATQFCRADGYCSAGVLGQTTTTGANLQAEWPVEAGTQYCVFVVNMTTSAQTLSGPVLYRYPYEGSE